MGQYNFVSPGAAAHQSIEQVLIRRRDEERQRLLDEIANRNADMEQQRTTSSIEASRGNQERQTLEAALGGLEQDEDISTHPQRSLLEKYGYGTKLPTPKVETSASFASPDGMGDFVTQGEGIELPGALNADNTTPQPPPAPPVRIGFKGTEVQRERSRKTGLTSEYGKRLQAATTPQERAAVMMEAEGQGIDMSGPAWTALTRTPQRTLIFDEASGKVLDASGQPVSGDIPEDAKFLTRNRPPAGPQGPTPRLFKSADGKKRVWVRPGQAVPEGYMPDTGAGGGNKQPMVVPPALRNAFNNHRRDAAAGKPGANEGFAQAQQAIISDSLQRGLASDDVADTIRDIIEKDLNVPGQSWGQWFRGEDGATPPTYDELIANYADAFDTPEEYEQFKDLLANVI